jgi:hypothetical protein
MRSAAWAPWRFASRANPGLLILREILDSGRCRAKGRIAAVDGQNLEARRGGDQADDTWHTRGPVRSL